jgi:signal transduction histidine kinase
VESIRRDSLGGLGSGHRGLGLFVSRQIVGAHGWRIQVESQPGYGALFSVHLPRLP